MIIWTLSKELREAAVSFWVFTNVSFWNSGYLQLRIQMSVNRLGRCILLKSVVNFFIIYWCIKIVRNEILHFQWSTHSHWSRFTNWLAHLCSGIKMITIMVAINWQQGHDFISVTNVFWKWFRAHWQRGGISNTTWSSDWHLFETSHLVIQLFLFCYIQ